MKRLALLLFLVPALAQGLVLPFEGPRGYQLAQAFALGLQAPPPTLLARLLPEPPWRQGYGLVGPLPWPVRIGGGMRTGPCSSVSTARPFPQKRP
jgi:hypothetical protein